MPPKRGRSARAASRSSTTAAPPAARDSAAATASPSPQHDPTLRRTPGAVRMSPGPSTYSNSYGSPAILPSTRTFRAGSATRVLGNVLQSVGAANQQDHHARERASRFTPRRMRPGAAAATNDGNGGSEADDEDRGAVRSDDEEEDSRFMPPPPRPSQSKSLRFFTLNCLTIICLRRLATRGPC